MSSSAENSRRAKKAANGLQLPDRTAFKSVAEYNANVTAYWKTIDRYRGLATELHRQIMDGAKREAGEGKEDHDPK